MLFMKFNRLETPSENRVRPYGGMAQRAFTLVEILVVIAIIGVLAAVGTQGAKIAARKRDRARVEAHLERLKLVIDDYKLRHGTYPPDNPATPDRQPLYYELRSVYKVPSGLAVGTPSSQEIVTRTALQAAFGPFYDVYNQIDPSVPKRRDNVSKDHLPTLRTDEYFQDASGIRYLRVPVPDYSSGPFLWKYNCSGPVNNPTTYDIWAVYPESGDVNRMITIGNWK